jgi:glycosyltransferase involved in cell wall biosynthesis
MKLIVQIPCLNEEHTLPETVADIPREIPGVDKVEVLIIDDGSTDRTVEVAREVGVDHIVRHRNTKGLAPAFRTGIDACLRHGADIIVNTDGDNQYCGLDIPALIQPILRGEADIVVGDRQTQSVPHFSAFKKLLQKYGSAVVRRVSRTTVPDAVSGFRAISREAALQLNIVSPFSYTTVAAVPIRTNAKTRDSRLFKSIPQFVERSLTTMIRMYSMYRPLKFFVAIGALISFFGMLPIIRFLYFYAIGQGGGHIQSLVLAGALLVIGLMTFLIGLVADLIGFNRQLMEMTLEKVRRIELEMGILNDDTTAVDEAKKKKQKRTD